MPSLHGRLHEHSLRDPKGFAAAILLIVLCSACTDVTPRLGDRQRLTIADDDGGAPTAPLAARNFVLADHRPYLRVTTGEEHAGRKSFQIDLDAPSGRSLAPGLGGTAVLVFQYDTVPFPDHFSFYVRNVRGTDSLNVELKSDNTHVSWLMVQGLPEGPWKKVTLDLQYLTGLGPQSREADRNRIGELLLHFKGQGTLLLDGIGAPQPSVRALLEQLEASRTASRTGQSGVQMMRESEQRAIQEQITNLGDGAVPELMAVIEKDREQLRAPAFFALLETASPPALQRICADPARCETLRAAARKAGITDVAVVVALLKADGPPADAPGKRAAANLLYLLDPAEYEKWKDRLR